MSFWHLRTVNIHYHAFTIVSLTWHSLYISITIYLNYSKWDFVIHLCLHQTMRKFRVQLNLLILAFLFQLRRSSNSNFFFEFLQISWTVIHTCARLTEQPSTLITMDSTFIWQKMYNYKNWYNIKIFWK